MDLQKIVLEVKCRIVQSKRNNLRYTARDANTSDTVYFVKNTLHSLFADCTVSANGIKISSANGHYAHKCVIETEFSHGSDAKSTWLKYQGYEMESDLNAIPSAIFTQREILVRRSAQLTLYSKVDVDFFSCEKHLTSGVTLRISFGRSQNDFVMMSDDGAKHYQVKIDEEKWHQRIMCWE